MLAEPVEDQALLKANILDFNTQLAEFAQRFKQNNSGVRLSSNSFALQADNYNKLHRSQLGCGTLTQRSTRSLTTLRHMGSLMPLLLERIQVISGCASRSQCNFPLHHIDFFSPWFVETPYIPRVRSHLPICKNTWLTFPL